MEKTGKREVSLGMLLTVLTLTIVYVSTGSPAAYQALEMLLTPVLLFAGGSFGLDAYAKQIAPNK